MKQGIKDVFDKYFASIAFDAKTSEKMREVNLSFIMKNNDHKYFFSSGLIGCYPIRYTYDDQEEFLEQIFGINSVRAKEIFDEIKDINRSFKVSSDLVNNYIFYVVHRFLTNPKLKESDKIEYACEALNYFTLRTLAVIISNYFIYPISEAEAQSLYENLSNKYLIKTVKNWMEYTNYRSRAFIESKFFSTLKKFDNSKEISNAINDLFTRSKDTIKNMYRDFIDLHNNKKYMTTSSSSMVNADGEDTIADKLHGPELYYNYVISTLIDKNTFVKFELVELSAKIISGSSLSLAKNTIEDFFEFQAKSKQNQDRVYAYIHNVLTVSIEYLFKNRYIVKHSDDVVYIVNKIVGNLLYARGNDLYITEVKEEGSEIIKAMYNGKSTSDRYLSKLSNIIFVYICLRAFTRKHYG